jgi:hypothetical protein
MDPPRLPAWLGDWQKQRGACKRSEVDRKIGRKIEVAASRIAKMAAREPDRLKRRRFVGAARRFALNWIYA